MGNKHSHFEGKSAFKHLKEARMRGAKATAENHGTEAPGAYAAAADAAKEAAFGTGLLWIILMWLSIKPALVIISLFLVGYAIWKTCRSALLGWARLERLHRLIEQERWEIEHHRGQEREELIEMYKLKGFTGKLLDEAVEVTMADDNRLLMVMLEEELGLKLSSYDHPLRQAMGALIGTGIGYGLSMIGILSGHTIGFFIAYFIIISVVSWFLAKLEGNLVINAIVWNLSTGFFALGILYFLTELIHGR